MDEVCEYYGGGDCCNHMNGDIHCPSKGNWDSEHGCTVDLREEDENDKDI